MNNDLISRSALLEDLEYDPAKSRYNSPYSTFGVILAAPAVDAVPVIRCKDCKHWMYINDDVGLCVVDVPDIDGVVREEHRFCSYGERRTDES